MKGSFDNLYALIIEKYKPKKKKKSKLRSKCQTKAKAKYSVWPSAYASGAAVQCRKGKGFLAKRVRRGK